MTVQTFTPPRRITPAAERREIATYRQFGEARLAPDFLSGHGLPAGQLAVVAEDLRPITAPTEQPDLGRAMIGGAVTGALTGAFSGLTYGLYRLPSSPLSALLLACCGILLGMVVGMLAGMLSYAIDGWWQDSPSTVGFQAGRYTIVADDVIADEAARLLAAVSTERVEAAD